MSMDGKVYAFFAFEKIKERRFVNVDNKLQISYMDINKIKPYEKNPRKNDHAVDKVAKSIEQFGFKVPIIIDKNTVIVAGHTRYKAGLKLGMSDIPTIVADDLTKEQINGFRIADNRVTEEADWDWDILIEELDGLSDHYTAMDLGFEDSELSFLDDEEMEESYYTDKIVVPTYEPNGDKPDIEDMYDMEKVNELMKAINKSKISEKEKEFLKIASYRHIVFDYSNIAEYYAQSEKKVQELMEESALVLIDFDKALASGFVDFTIDTMESNEND